MQEAVRSWRASKSEFTIVKIVICINSLLFSQCLGNYPSELAIGAILKSNANILEEAFRLALEDVNSNASLLPDITLVPLVNAADKPYDAIAGTFNLASKGVVSLVGPLSTPLTQVAKIVCEQLGLPQISILATDPMLSWLPNSVQSSCISLKMSPPDTYLNRALASIIQYYEWSSFAVLTEESQYGLHGIMELQRLALKNDWSILSFQRFQHDSDGRIVNLTSYLKAIKETNVRIVVLHCSAKYSKEILHQADKLGMIRPGWAWLVTDAITIEGPRFLAEADGYIPSSLCGLLGVALATPDSPLLQNLLRRLGGKYNGIKQIYKQTIARIYDSVLAVANGLHNTIYVQKIPYEKPSFSKVAPCASKEIRPWKWGTQLFNAIGATRNITGCLGPLKFTEHGYHHLVNYDIVNLQTEGFVKVGVWMQRTNKLKISSNVIFPGQVTEAPKASHWSLFNKTIKIGVIKDMPFLMDNPHYQPEDANSLKYRGFLMDLLLKLQEKHKFQYTIQEVTEYGYKNGTTKQWNGLVQLLLEKKIDLAVAAFTISWERQEVIAFTKPFYDLGLTILMSKHNAATERRYFAFLLPFEPIVWATIFVAMLLASVSLIMCNNTLSHASEDKVTKDLKVTPLRAIWWSFSSLVSPGTGIKQTNTLASKIVMGSWWVTTFVLAASYTAKLAAVMTVEQMNKGINSLEELVSSEAIKFGTLASSYTRNFFHNSRYSVHQNAYHFMVRHNTFVESSEEGIRKVRESYYLPEGHKDRYALIYDSPIMEYAATQQPCNVKTVGRLFGLQNYGFGLRKNSPYEKQLSVSILQLRENGYMDILQQKWFTAACSENGRKEYESVSLSIWNLIGIFGVFLCGIIIALILAALQRLKRSKKSLKIKDNVVPSTGKEWLSIAHEFEEMWQFPQCLGALDGKHVPIIYPKDSGSAYFNYKGFYSIVMMAVVSADLSFIYVDAGTNGRQCDSSIWNASSLKKAMEVGHLNFPPDKPLCEGRRASPYVFVTDEGIGMSTRVLRPYAQKQLTHERRIFNYRLSRARRVVENAFGILYSVWRVFANTILLSPEKAAKVVLTCCVLHNMLRGRKVPSYVNTECGGDEGKQSAAGIPLQSFENGRHLNAVSSRAKIVRDEYASFFFNEGKVEWQWKHLQNT